MGTDQINKGYEREFFDCVELGLAKRQTVFGVDSEELIEACKKVGHAFKEIAEKKIGQGKFESAFKYLKRGEAVVKNDPETLLIIITNMAHLQQKMGNNKLALKYLLQALDINDNVNHLNPLRKSQIHLNICAIASSIGKHKMALKYSNEAIGILEDSHDYYSITANRASLVKCNVEDGHETLILETLAIAYYNTAVEHEHLSEFNPSYTCYEKGLSIASRCFGDGHAMVQAFNLSIQMVSRKLKK